MTPHYPFFAYHLAMMISRFAEAGDLLLRRRAHMPMTTTAKVVAYADGAAWQYWSASPGAKRRRYSPLTTSGADMALPQPVIGA